MGWWETHDGTVIGDSLADMVGEHFDKMVEALVERYPAITRDQVLHTMAFCSGSFKHFDENSEMPDTDNILTVMTVKQRRLWADAHSLWPDMSKRVRPDTDLRNVRNPFTGDVI